MNAFDSTIDPFNSLAEAQRLFYLGQLPAAISMAQKAAVSHTLALQAQLLIIRCLFGKGNFHKAEVVWRTALETSSSEREVIWNMPEE
jgi:tetratricopeptide (TPR) repeat protein